MSDIVLGMIIGGIIGVVGSAAVAWIQGHYSLKVKREDNLARQHEQSVQIQHEKDRELTNRIIEARSKYLEDLSEQLGRLQTSVEDFGEKLLALTVPYLPRTVEGTSSAATLEEIRTLEKVQINIKAAKKRDVMRQLETLETYMSSISTNRQGIYESFFRVKDVKLARFIQNVVETVFSLQQDYVKMRLYLSQTETDHDFIYDLAPILKLVPNVSVNSGHAHRRIESLIAGADIGDE